MTDMTDWNRQTIEAFRANGGKVGGMWEGRPLLLLTTTGAKSGQRHTNPTMYLPDGDRLLVFPRDTQRDCSKRAEKEEMFLRPPVRTKGRGSERRKKRNEDGSYLAKSVIHRKEKRKWVDGPSRQENPGRGEASSTSCSHLKRPANREPEQIVMRAHRQ
jgi:F420H(2)-dependent quinone reductase